MSSEPSHIQSWNGLDRHHRENAFDKFIEQQRPKQIMEYYDDTVKHMVKRFSPGYGCKVTI